MNTLALRPAVAEMPFCATFFDSPFNPVGHVPAFGLSSLLDWLEKSPCPRETRKEDLPLWSPASFGEKCEAEAREEDEREPGKKHLWGLNYRDKKRVIAVSMLGFDVDIGDVIARDKLLEALEGYAGFFYCTSSSTPEKPKWRLVLFLSRLVSANDYEHVWHVIRERLTFCTNIAANSCDPSRQWFTPRVPERGDYIFCRFDGAPVDVEEALACDAPLAKVSTKGSEAAHPFITAEHPDYAASHAKAIEYAKNHKPSIAGENGHGDLWNVASYVRCDCAMPDDVSLAIIKEHFNPRCEPEWSDREITHKIQSAANTLARDTAFKEQREGEVFFSCLTAIKQTAVAEPTPPTLTGATPQNDNQAEGVVPKPKGHAFTWGGWDKLPPPVDFVVQGFLPKGSVTMFAAPGNSLKTWVVYSLAIAVATGRPWLGTYAAKQGRVAIVDYESGGNETARRLYKLGAGSCADLGVLTYGPKLLDKEFWSLLREAKPDLVVIDSLAAGNPGVDENTTAASVPLTLASAFSEETGCTVVFIHHSPKASGSGSGVVRGSSAIFDGLDCGFTMSEIVKGAGDTQSVNIKCIKPGPMRHPEDITFEMSEVDGRILTRSATSVSAPLTLEQRVKNAISENPGIKSKARIYEIVGGNIDKFRAALKSLLEAREVSQIQGGVYVVDRPEKRYERIKEFVRGLSATGNSDSTVSKIAKGAFVKDDDVNSALFQKIIFKSHQHFTAAD